MPDLTPAQFSVKYEDIVYDEKRFFSADTTFFEIFDFPFLAGNSKTALKEPMNIVIIAGYGHKILWLGYRGHGKIAQDK